MGTRALALAILPGLNAKEAGKNVRLLGFHWKGFDGTFYKLLSEDLASN